MRRITCAALSAALALAALAVTGCAATRANVAVSGPPQPAVWAIRDADSTMYFFGAIHLRKRGAPWGGPVAERALGQAARVWTEVEIDPARDAEVQTVVGRYGFDPVHPLSSRMTPARIAQMHAAAAGIGMAPAALDAMKPWLASLTLTVVPMIQAGYDPQSGVDRTIDRLAEASGKTMRWFETGEEQIRFLAGMSDPLQVAMLNESLDDVGKGTGDLTRMEAAWEVGDDATLARDMVADMRREYPELYNVMLKNRNAAWTEVLSREMAGSGVDFIAVGAAHLVGPDSVLAMMRARGFAVERISPPTPRR